MSPSSLAIARIIGPPRNNNQVSFRVRMPDKLRFVVCFECDTCRGKRQTEVCRTSGLSNNRGNPGSFGSIVEQARFREKFDGAKAMNIYAFAIIASRNEIAWDRTEVMS